MVRKFHKPVRAATFLALVLSVADLPEGRAAPAGAGWGLCATQTARLERLRRIPDHLLTAISLVEAGRYHTESGRTVAWPWTVTAAGRGRYFDSRAAAVREVARLRADGVENIDVGCMQVNLYWHGAAFASLEEAFDPARNVDYAAEFLSELRQAEGSWDRAVARYHSRTPRFQVAYAAKVRSAWQAARAEAAPADRRPGLAVGAIDKPGREPPVRLGRAPTVRLGPVRPATSRRARVAGNAPGEVAWRQARPGGRRGAQIILRENRRHVVLKPGRNWAGRASPVTP